MKKMLGFILIVLLMLSTILTGCTAATVASTPAVTMPTTTTSPPLTTTPPTTTTSPLAVEIQMAEEAIKNSATFKFDGIASSIKLINATSETPISSFRATLCTFEFQTAQPGHGDRSGLMLAQVITTHRAEVYVDQDSDQVKMAFCDATWDLIKDKALPVSISGIILSGGDTTPAGLLDAPRTFVYQVKQDDGTMINVSYKSYPPSPAGGAARAKIHLEFYAGSILTGDRIYASGILDDATNTIVIAEEGGYIRTAIPKMEVTGKVLNGGDTTPEGLFDAPRRFVYQIEQANGEIINVSYTAYPPSPAGDIANRKISISTYNEGIQAGDYLRAYGTYHLPSNTVSVTEEGDFIKTYPMQP
jgi:hypothetical protein